MNLAGPLDFSYAFDLTLVYPSDFGCAFDPTLAYPPDFGYAFDPTLAYPSDFGYAFGPTLAYPSEDMAFSDFFSLTLNFRNSTIEISMKWLAKMGDKFSRLHDFQK